LRGNTANISSNPANAVEQQQTKLSCSAVSSRLNEPGSLSNSTGQRDLAALIASIPFRKLLIWASVVFVAYQLSDFFGVGRAVKAVLCMAVAHPKP
jgi:hypothetical protein